MSAGLQNLQNCRMPDWVPTVIYKITKMDSKLNLFVIINEIINLIVDMNKKLAELNPLSEFKSRLLLLRFKINILFLKINI